jgi:hypothetical protein
MATKIGVGGSTRFPPKHKSTFARLASSGGCAGERFFERCAPAPEALATGVHTEAWLARWPEPYEPGGA